MLDVTDKTKQKFALLYILQLSQVCILYKEHALQSVTIYPGKHNTLVQTFDQTQKPNSENGTLCIGSHSNGVKL